MSTIITADHTKFLTLTLNNKNNEERTFELYKKLNEQPPFPFRSSSSDQTFKEERKSSVSFSKAFTQEKRGKTSYGERAFTPTANELDGIVERITNCVLKDKHLNNLTCDSGGCQSCDIFIDLIFAGDEISLITIVDKRI
ncbi:MAG: hypothetical protein KDK71_06295 [Chlamydiia bacterium]|nr:hypothetical protein [Chlamydiia bacterium]